MPTAEPQAVATFPATMVFRRPWRTYQARVLERLDTYLEDRRLHLVAAPGSGKTVLGLEIIRRIDRRTLVLAPTITIRNQWIERLIDLFMPEGAKPDWISTDLRKPAAFTVATYQALHALYCGNHDSESEAEEATAPDSAAKVNNEEKVEKHDAPLPESLRTGNFRTLVVDEAHHLRAEWWKTLTAFCDELEQPTIVALTATPPYDVSFFEWQRYEELCGPVDTEVSVPELVLQGDLCPHQDYVFFSVPAPQEQKTLADFRQAVNSFVASLKQNAAFAAAIAGHPWIVAPAQYTEEILDTPEFLSSMAVFLHAVGKDEPPDVLHTLGLRRKNIPALNPEWLEILLTKCLYADVENFQGREALFRDLRHQLQSIGALEHRRVKLQDPSDHTKLLTTSVTKLHSIEEIVRLEAGALKDQLRSVILTDFIRRSELPHSASDACQFEDIGVVPIFETLRRSSIAGMRLGVLSGSLIIVPQAAEQKLVKTAERLRMDAQDLSITPLEHDSSFSKVELRGEYDQGAVRLITEVFAEGDITVLVGTKSLLGEGWDAPCINTLILASFVSSYMLSNQMRGRSIRIDPAHPEKTANIWHLVCAEPGLFGPGPDYELLKRRCGAFAGVAADEPKIENGISRLRLAPPPFNRDQIDECNKLTRERALNRAGLRNRWQEALAAGNVQTMVDGIKAPTDVLPRGFVLVNTIAMLLMQAAATFMYLLFSLLRGAGRLPADRNLLTWLSIVFGVPVVVSVPMALRALWRFARHGTPERSIRSIGRAVLASFEEEGLIDYRSRDFVLTASRNDDGTVFCGISGGTGKEQALYLRTVRELLDPIGNPRYFLARKRFTRFFFENYFPVPEVLARKRESAEAFAKNWQKFVGPVDLIYSRTPEGREILLRARMHSLAASFQGRAERVSCWK